MIIEEIKKKVRTLLSIAPKIGVVAKASGFKRSGISAVIRVKNEEDWIRPSILSIKDFVEEILIVDNGSTDGTLDVVEQVASEISTPTRVFRYPEADHCEISNVGVINSEYKWILKWDADFIAHTDGPESFGHFRDFVFQLDPDRYYMILMSVINLTGDLWHTPVDTPRYIRSAGVSHTEGYCWSFTPQLHYVWKNYKGISKVESLQFPPFYQFLGWPQLSVFHVGGIRPIQRMLMDYFWHEWKYRYAGCETEDKVSLEEFAWQQASIKFHASDAATIIKNFFHQMKKDIVPYDYKRYSPYPKILLPYLENPKYRIVYDDEKNIIGRSPDCI